MDLSIFKEPNVKEDCQGHSDCGRLPRIAAVLKYHQLLLDNYKSNIDNARQILIEFLDSAYSCSLLLDDYIDFFANHSGEESRRALSAHLRDLRCSCASVGECGGTSRHYRERQDDKHHQEGDMAANLFLDLIDTLHFNIFHLEHVGLRVPARHDEIKADARGRMTRTRRAW